MKIQIQQLVSQALASLGLVISNAPMIERTRDKSHGDFACNVAMVLAKVERCRPRDLAEKIVAVMPDVDWIEKIELAGPGFINFKLAPFAYQSLIATIIEEGDLYGQSQLGAGKKVQIEFVSANPTGPLHVGHGRGAAYGSVIGNLLRAIGYDVHCEYYVNDAGRQMDILATSVWLRYLSLCDVEFEFPANGYKGDYIWDIAASLHREYADGLMQSVERVFQEVPLDEPKGGNKETHIDGLIVNAKQLLGEVSYRIVFNLALQTILDDIKNDLALFGVDYDNWFSELSLMTSNKVSAAIARLQKEGHVYEKDGALWFKSTAYGDEKDRVVVRENGQTTYFASDIAYHMNKLDRGYDRIIDVWGADHHGYIARVNAAINAMDGDDSKLSIRLVQFASLYRGGKKVQMSTRSGSFVTLRELRNEVGVDAARFFYVMRRCEQHMDFDLDLAKSKTNENPVYYIQYAHARVCSVFRQAKEKGLTIDLDAGLSCVDRLTNERELDLLKTLGRFPSVIELAAVQQEPHQLTQYLRDLANEFHTYYNADKFLIDDVPTRDARLALIVAVRQVLKNGLGIIGVSAPDSM